MASIIAPWRARRICCIVEVELKGRVMRWDGTGLPYIEQDDDFGECARFLADAYDGEYALFPSIDPDSIEAAALAAFMPMAARIETTDGPRAFLVPKLHLERCLLDPMLVSVTRTARRESARYSLSLNSAFREVAQACVQTHGDDWLVPELVDAFCELHDCRAARRIGFVSVELWKACGKDQELVAGELGYVIGKAYASLTGFSRASGAGTVQLAALGRALADAGVSVWDLGMPIEYKQRLGGRVLPRARFMPVLRRAYEAENPSVRAALLSASGVVAARSMIDSGSICGPKGG
jgi:Leu/Phe-tRNA-protein transferase